MELSPVQVHLKSSTDVIVVNCSVARPYYRDIRPSHTRRLGYADDDRRLRKLPKRPRKPNPNRRKERVTSPTPIPSRKASAQENLVLIIVMQKLLVTLPRSTSSVENRLEAQL